MIRVLTVVALLSGLAAFVWTQSDAESPQDRATTLNAPPRVQNPAPHDSRLEISGFTTPAPGTRPFAASIAVPHPQPLTSWIAPTAAADGRSILQTAYFDSSEPLPPGAEFPEGPQLQRGPQLPEPAPLNVTPPANGPQFVPVRSTSETQPVATPEEQFVTLFNGVDLNDWHVHDGKPEAWSVTNGVIRCDKASGGWLRTTANYSDFELRFDLRLSDGANTGLAFRFPESGSPTATGIELQLLDDAAPKYADLRDNQYTGSLYYQLPPLHRSSIPVGEWTPVEVTVRGSRIQARVNGETVTDVFLDQLPGGDAPHPLQTRPAFGFIGWQSSGSPVEFRNIRIHDLTTRFDSGLQIIDLQTGTGEACPAGAQVTVEYRGTLESGVQFDSSYERGEPLTVRLDDVIAGWQTGLPGMRVGGRRKLIVPAALAYGDAGVPGLIPAGSILAFEVELRGIER